MLELPQGLQEQTATACCLLPGPQAQAPPPMFSDRSHSLLYLLGLSAAATAILGSCVPPVLGANSIVCSWHKAW